MFTKTTNSLFEPPFGGIRGNVCTSSIAPWKACGRLRSCSRYTSSYGWDIISRYCRSGRFLKMVGHVKCKFMGTSPTNLCWYQNTSRLITISCGIKILAVYSLVSSQSTSVTDRQNYDPQDRASIAASHHKNDQLMSVSSSIQPC